MAEQYCSYCKNRCLLSNPKCDNFRSPESVAKREKDAKKAANTCKICDKHCPLDALGCDLGKTIYELKAKKQQIKKFDEAEGKPDAFSIKTNRKETGK